MLIVTTNDLPGFTVTRVLGEVFGVTVRSLNAGTSFTAGFRSIGGGEVPEMTNLVLQGRNEAMNRLIYEARRHGANAILAMRFDTGELAGRWNEVCAYGTAAWVEPVTDEARAQYAAMVTAGQVPPGPLGGPSAPPMPGQPQTT